MRKPSAVLALLVCGVAGGLACSALAFASPAERVVVLRNECLACSLTVRGGVLVGETISAEPVWLGLHGARSLRLQGDGDFAVELFWTDWSAPGKRDNADNEVTISAGVLQSVSCDTATLADGTREAKLLFKHVHSSLQVLLTYQLPPARPYVRRQVAVSDPKHNHHWLHWFWPRRGVFRGPAVIHKEGSFGQPAAVLVQDGGAFFGVEYPAASTVMSAKAGGAFSLACGHEMGVAVDSTWVTSEWVVTGLSPNAHVELWFSRYVDDIRVAPLRPYLLYNSWYDVRAPEYTERQEDVMNQANVLRIVADFKREMWEKRGLRLDAFVLDDGWDVYKSDWVLRPQEFPQGLKPISLALDSMGTRLGIWLGPIGGYSHRDWRVGWMKEHGYETVGDQMCVAGAKYRALLKQRVLGLVQQEGVGYFKWDGIQFSCSEQDHGHPVGVYSRRAVMEAMADLCQSVRAARPDIFLNVTSGTWLSPWWLKYANTIWMQGADYGYADVPSISRRDAAITYRDHVLYEDYGINRFWFPIANLMTHGIIKGNLQKLGGEDEPLDKFTNDVVLYFARGVTMWELYISPNLLTEGEWDALAKSIAWARDRFDLLTHTTMIGGHPGRREPYGYAHFAGQRGIVAVRNPFVEPKEVAVPLDPCSGLDRKAASLVVERIYPTRYVMPELYAAGAVLSVPLQGYETAIFEIYPLPQSIEPLVAGVTFEELPADPGSRRLRLFGEARHPCLLNPEAVAPQSLAEVLAQVSALSNPEAQRAHLQGLVSFMRGKGEVEVSVDVPAGHAKAELAVLFEREPGPGDEQGEWSLRVRADGQEVQPALEGNLRNWLWAKIDLRAGQHRVRYRLTGKGKAWKGSVAAWLIQWRRPPAVELTIPLKVAASAARPLPPKPWPPGVVEELVKVGEARIQ
ncbi:MAG: alpha-galactosidase [candidate division KSB1 bacterium]|nr:alpha-galactosidase [candidate division KSB1 bacterium]